MGFIAIFGIVAPTCPELGMSSTGRRAIVLALTDQAASIVTAIVTNQAEEETAGLRIMQADSTHPEDVAFGL